MFRSIIRCRRFPNVAPTRQFWSSSSPYSMTRIHRGPLKAAILDWSGTVADNWVIAPARAFVDVFKEELGLVITMNQARVPMGLRKDLHIDALMKMPAIIELFKAKFGRLPNEKDVKAVFDSFIPIQLKCLPKYCGMIPHAVKTVERLRNSYGLKIGMTTGFQRPMVDILLAHTAKEGYRPDVNVAGCEVSKPRPFPYMIYKNMELLGIQSASSVLKVDDTVSGIGEGLNANSWTCALSHTSTYMDINSMEERHAMSNAEFNRRGVISREILINSGAHYVIPDISGLPDVVEDINKRMYRGEKP